MFSDKEYEQVIGRLYMEGMSIQNIMRQLQSTIEQKEKENAELVKRLEEISKT